MTAAMIKLVARLPELLARAALGDPIAIATLAVMGITFVGSEIGGKK